MSVKSAERNAGYRGLQVDEFAEQNEVWSLQNLCNRTWHCSGGSRGGGGGGVGGSEPPSANSYCRLALTK